MLTLFETMFIALSLIWGVVLVCVGLIGLASTLAWGRYTTYRMIESEYQATIKEKLKEIERAINDINNNDRGAA